MLSIVQTISLVGLNGKLVEVQTDVSNGLPDFEIIGMPDLSIKESKERIKSAIKNSNIPLASKKILVNLAPADTRKEGSSYDLPIAIGILSAIGIVHQTEIRQTILIGELALNGKINQITGVLPICIEAKKMGIKTIYVPKQNEKEASIVEDINIIPVETLRETIEFLNGKKKIENSKSNTNQIMQTKLIQESNLDFADVKGQESVKRALEIAAAGGHNCILEGSPRCRKNNASKKNVNNITRSYI